MHVRPKPPSLLDEFNKQYILEKLGDPLIKINQIIDWESFRSAIESCYDETDPRKGGRPSFDRVMLFKILILQSYYELSDDAMEYQINDRFSFMRFLGLGINDKVPDAKTIWLFREKLSEYGILDDLFVKFGEYLEEIGLVVNKGKIVDATILEVPRQRNSREENKKIKDGMSPGEWSENKARQKDTDASWTVKHDKKYFGYKDHIVIDKGSKLITDFEVTPANISDLEIGEELVEGIYKGEEFYADRGYPSQAMSEKMQSNGIIDKVMKKGARYVQLSEEEKLRNAKISKVRCIIEHVFGFMKRNNLRFHIRSHGLRRATAKITLMNLVYNFMRSIKLINNRKIAIRLSI